MYEKADQFVEKWSKFINIFFVRIGVTFLILPKVMQSYVTYFITDLGVEAFALPVPMWYDFFSFFKV